VRDDLPHFASAVGDPVAAADGGPGCLTCSDALTAMRVLEIDRPRELAVCVTEGGDRCTVDTALIGTVSRGEVLLVQAGTALTREGG